LHDGGEAGTAPEAPNPGSFPLVRLRRFAALMADPGVRETPVWYQLARRAAAAAFADCLDLGLRDEALAILHAIGVDPPEPPERT
jgi:hypothetical protein